MNTPQSTIETGPGFADSQDMTKHPASIAQPILVLIGLVLVLLGSACGHGPDADSAVAPVASSAQPTAAPSERPEVEADTIADALVGHFDGLTAETGEPISDDEAEVLRDSVIGLLVPDGVDADDAVAFAEALAGRLGGDYADETDPDVLLEALIAELTTTGDITTLDELLAAIEAWATDGVIMIGSTSGSDSIGATTTFQRAVEMVENGHPGIDLIPGISPIELRNVAVDVDHEHRRITLSGRIPAPIAGEAEVTIDFAGGAPSLAFALERDELRLDQVTALPLGELGSLGFDSPTLTISTDGVEIAAGVDPANVPGAAAAGVPSGAVPLTLELPGFGSLGAPEAELAFDIEIPFGDMTRLGDWQTRRDGMLTITVGDKAGARWSEAWTVRIGESDLRFSGDIAVRSTGDAELAMMLEGSWAGAFGAEWLTIERLTLAAERSGEATTARFTGDFRAAGTGGRLEFAITSGSTGTSMPAIWAVRAARGPDALTTCPQETTSPEARVTLSTCVPAALRVIATTSFWIHSTPRSRLWRRHQSFTAPPSQYPSSTRLIDPSTMSSTL